MIRAGSEFRLSKTLPTFIFYESPFIFGISNYLAIVKETAKTNGKLQI
jgi:hypothetical protein